MATLILTDLTTGEFERVTAALNQSGREYVSTQAVWTRDEAAALYEALARRQKDFLGALVRWQGAVPANEVRTDDGGLRGLTGPITKAVARLSKQGVIREGLPEVVTGVFDPSVSGYRRATGFRMDGATVAAFGEVVQSV